ncbi:hypothetical protein SPRG_09630 [Saprolegnia parasitica CBS 223.65]|uniref:subtilisin n=1 Tax=Saprolegnia parasitica (strain CBS 223.65) TaxID=695850 RepID=A0A067C1Y2_SAPPC|nr:hypothetical protein SPRG_09630 [Saprolegnia parasitica CBS 223.65]KDO24769.1 hypothetical protein SPRG_09630 [Saprolegnia parasitica CBS 223.65]|eukprot:XP_012204446.1 hypothetical protein SPRG_09630 [Saprolegnia parasitica CBS 223.65]
MAASKPILLLLLVWLGILAVVAIDPPTGNHRKIDLDLWNDLHTKASVDAIVEFEGLQKFWSDKTEHTDLDKPSSNVRVRDLLRSVADTRSKAPHRRRLESAPEVCPGIDDVQLQDLWVANQFKVFSLTLCIAEQLSNLPRVHRLRYGYTMTIGTHAVAMQTTTSSANSWGITAIGAPAAWALGHTGQGVLVGSIDSGVRSTHEALSANFRGAYGWYDAVTKSPTPIDENGHGTHTMGTIAGSHGVGVAPGVTWMACRACSASECKEADLLTCMQFMLCPTDVNGENDDCSKAPHVVSNSWGAGATDLGSYRAAVEAWRRAGIIPIFSNGNTGASGCASVQSPADYDNVISVGNIDSTGALSTTSSRGPTKAGSIKPTLSAPGSAITSASNKGDGSYAVMSGTSMAAPHVTGAVALLLSQHPSWGYDEILNALTTSATTSTLKPSTPDTCGAAASTTFPNNHFGHGLLSLAVPSPTTAGNGSTLPPSTILPLPSASSHAPGSTRPPATTTTPAPTVPPSELNTELNTDVLIVTPSRSVVVVASNRVRATSVSSSSPIAGATFTYSPLTQQVLASNGECLTASPMAESSGAFLLHTWPCRLSNVNQRWLITDQRIAHGRHKNQCLAVVASSAGVARCDPKAPSQVLSALPLDRAMAYLSSRRRV